MFRTIVHRDLASLETLPHLFIKSRRNAAALLALDHVFSRVPVLKSHTLLEMSLFLNKFRRYTRLLHDIISHPDPLRVTSIRRLFCITKISNTEWGMEPGSFLHSSATGDRDGPMYLQTSVVTLSEREMVAAIQKYLALHLRERHQQNILSLAGPVQCCTVTHSSTIGSPLSHPQPVRPRVFDAHSGHNLSDRTMLRQCATADDHCLCTRRLLSVYDVCRRLFHPIPSRMNGEGTIS